MITENPHVGMCSIKRVCTYDKSCAEGLYLNCCNVILSQSFLNGNPVQSANMYDNSSASTMFQNKTQQQQYNSGLQEMSKLLPIAIAITLTNGLVLFMFYRKKSLRTASNYLLLSLAVCDFLTGTINIPYYIIFSFSVVRVQAFGYWMFILHTLIAISAGYHILMITAQRYFAIIKPLSHQLVTKTPVCKISLGIWLISSGLALVPLTWRTLPSANTYFVAHAASCLLMVFFVPYSFMVYAYRVMFRAISKRKIPGLSNQDSTTQRVQKKKIKDRKCILIFAIMAAVYAICWLPYFTLMLIFDIRKYLMMDSLTSIDNAIEVFVIIRYMTSIANPLLYTFFKRDFWLALKTLLITRQLTIA